MTAKLTVEPPYHFGWRIKDENEAVHWQEIDLDQRNTDIMLYKDEKVVGWWKVIK